MRIYTCTCNSTRKATDEYQTTLQIIKIRVMSFGLFLIILYFSDTMIINGCSVYIVPLVSTACIHLLMKANPMSSREAMKIINQKRSKVSRTV